MGETAGNFVEPRDWFDGKGWATLTRELTIVDAAQIPGIDEAKYAALKELAASSSRIMLQWILYALMPTFFFWITQKMRLATWGTIQLVGAIWIFIGVFIGVILMRKIRIQAIQIARELNLFEL